MKTLKSLQIEEIKNLRNAFEERELQKNKLTKRKGNGN